MASCKFTISVVLICVIANVWTWTVVHWRFTVLASYSWLKAKFSDWYKLLPTTYVLRRKAIFSVMSVVLSTWGGGPFPPCTRTCRKETPPFSRNYEMGMSPSKIGPARKECTEWTDEEEGPRPKPSLGTLSPHISPLARVRLGASSLPFTVHPYLPICTRNMHIGGSRGARNVPSPWTKINHLLGWHPLRCWLPLWEILEPPVIRLTSTPA